MTDYPAVGFKAGIEIHQQIEGEKLFSRAPTIISREQEDYTMRRQLRATGGEHGQIDAAARHEQAKGKVFAYLGYSGTTSLVELDDEPPQPLNRVALGAALQVALLLQCTIVDQVHVMRKIVIDGSNTSGFQRTMLIGHDGQISVAGKKISIQSICLEEESCQAIKRAKDEDLYNLSRLGIPLIEIATGPDISSPQEAQECARQIGMILRATGACKRGIGSIRQDLNMSIAGGERIEIKGFQDLRSIPDVLEKETARQQKMLEKNERIESHVRKAEPDGSTTFLRPMPGAARMYPETDILPFVPETRNIKLPKLLSEVSEDLEKLGIAKDLAGVITKKELPIAEMMQSYPDVEPKFLADVLVSMPKELKKRYGVEVEDILLLADEPLRRLEEGAITREAVIEAIALIAQGKQVDWKQYAPVDAEDAEKAIITLIRNNPGASPGMLMGLAMKELRGKVPGKTVSELITKHAGKR